MKFFTTFLCLLFSVFCHAQSQRVGNYWHLSIDSLTSLRQQDSLYIKKAILILSKDSNITKINDLFDEIYDANWGSFITYLNAKTYIEIIDNIEIDFSINEEESFKLLIRRGFCKYLYNKYHEAIFDLNSAIKIKPSNGYSFWFRGLCKQSLSDYYGAIDDFSNSIEKASSDDDYLRINTYLSMEKSHESLKNYSAAINIYSKIIELEPSECKFYLERGKLKLTERQKINACLDLSKAGELGCIEAYTIIKESCN